VRYFLQLVEPLLPEDAVGLQRSFQLSHSEAADLSALHSVSPSFKTSVPFQPKYFGVFLWVFLAFQLSSVNYGTQWTETLIYSNLSVTVYVWFSNLLFILHKFTQIS